MKLSTHNINMELYVFNFFEELKKEYNLQDFYAPYKMINLSNNFLYVEGHLGIVSFSKECVVFKIKKGRVLVNGKDLSFAELTSDTLVLKGIIKSVEIV